MNYHIILGPVTGEIAQNGQVKVTRREIICRLHEPCVMVDGIHKDEDTIEIFSKCPTCGIEILQGYYKNEDPTLLNMSN